jgi:hypothetical protein
MKRIIRLTESDLARIVRRVMSEGVTIEVEPTPWNKITTVNRGDGMKYNSEDDTIRHYVGGNLTAEYNNFKIIENPTKSYLQSNMLNVVSFDPSTKVVKLNNGVSIGPA